MDVIKKKKNADYKNKFSPNTMQMPRRIFLLIIKLMFFNKIIIWVANNVILKQDRNPQNNYNIVIINLPISHCSKYTLNSYSIVYTKVWKGSIYVAHDKCPYMSIEKGMFAA